MQVRTIVSDSAQGVFEGRWRGHSLRAAQQAMAEPGGEFLILVDWKCRLLRAGR